MKIAVAGATGFVGCHLVQHLLENSNHEIIALSRSGGESSQPRLSFIQADLYSLLETERALKGADIAIYLVHSMSPSSRLIQGHFQDFDFLLADNFARASQKVGIKKIIYVSGLVPEGDDLSVHLSSRLEVESVLSSYSVPTTTLRCGLVLGPNGSSFRILEKLVERLPVMVMPTWMKNKTQVIYIGDLVKILEKEIEDMGPVRVYDVGHPDVMTYEDLLQLVVKAKNKKPMIVDLPWIPVGLSKLWVRLVTGVSKDLVYPLVDSLVHSMLVDPARQLPKAWTRDLTPISEAIRRSVKEKPCRLERKSTLTRNLKQASEVQSVQRLKLPHQKSALWVADAYIHWLPRHMRNLVHAEREGNRVSFYLRPLDLPLLVLELSKERSTPSRQLFYVTGGVLIEKGSRGRLEFRESPDKLNVLTGIHRFKPRLPWVLYRFTQALMHAWVMNRFGRYLKRVA